MSPKVKLQKLFEPWKLGKIEIRNRIVLAPMGTNYTEWEEGFVTDRLIDYYAERAIGGTGLIIPESAYAYPYWQRLSIHDDKFIPGLARLADAIHKAGSKLVMHINPCRGRADAYDPVSPSDVPHPVTGARPRPLSIDEIQTLIERFSDAAVRAYKAGCDAVQVHGANGYALSEFLSPLTNKRTDRYGGSLENRARLAVEIIAATKAKTAADFPVMYRLMADEHREGGFSLEEAIPFCQMLEKAGADAVEATAGHFVFTPEWLMLPMGFPRGPNVNLSEGIKKAVNIPVGVVGRLNDPYLAEEVLRQGKADYIVLGRALIADPEFSKKAMEGRVEDIRPCIACQTCQDNIVTEKTPLSCSVNPTVGRERQARIRRARKAKHVLVIGGGPAGMEAAIVAAQRGHRVTLWEKQDKLGGQLLLAAVPPDKWDIGDLTRYLSRQVEKSGVQLGLGIEATAESVKKLKPDAVIVATGARPAIPDIPGATGSNVVTALEVLAASKKVGREVLIIGGGMIGCETAEFLIEKGKKVSILEMLDSVAQDMSPHLRQVFLPKLKKTPVIIETKVKAVEITDKGVRCLRDGVSQFFKGDTVVLAAGTKPNSDLASELKGKVGELYSIGDCVDCRRIQQAIQAGFRVARKI